MNELIRQRKVMVDFPPYAETLSFFFCKRCCCCLLVFVVVDDDDQNYNGAALDDI